MSAMNDLDIEIRDDLKSRAGVLSILLLELMNLDAPETLIHKGMALVGLAHTAATYPERIDYELEAITADVRDLIVVVDQLANALRKAQA